MKTNKLKQIGKVDLSSIYGGTKLHPTTIGDPEKPTFTDVHIDKDEDDKWTAGDEFVVTMV